MIKKNLISDFEYGINKIHFEWFLAAIRGISIFLFCLVIVGLVHATFFEQSIVAAIILFSDLFDGMISRKVRNANEQYLFRIADAIIDKVGAIFVLVLLVLEMKSDNRILLIITTYYFILASYPLFYITRIGEKKVSYIQATFLSRSVAFFTGIYCLIANNYRFNDKQAQLIAIFFCIIATSSLVSHICKISKLNQNNSKEHA